ncbi:hypothetical protein EZS27_025531 [termite gut metagenome]|uniref:Uncharacterized protein n=1 Tax=termite gut metagenome TaxID=433724 RepID=A0A5J4QX42_9ZZZZ
MVIKLLRLKIVQQGRMCVQVCVEGIYIPRLKIEKRLIYS